VLNIETYVGILLYLNKIIVYSIVKLCIFAAAWQKIDTDVVEKQVEYVSIPMDWDGTSDTGCCIERTIWI